MNIVAEMSLYPLKDGPVPTIIGFIEDMRRQAGIEIVTNQLSTQVSGRFDAVTWSSYLSGNCVFDFDFAPDGSVWVVAQDGPVAWPDNEPDRSTVRTYVISPDAVAATE